jgi:hypothetical protein
MLFLNTNINISLYEMLLSSNSFFLKTTYLTAIEIELVLNSLLLITISKILKNLNNSILRVIYLDRLLNVNIF